MIDSTAFLNPSFLYAASLSQPSKDLFSHKQLIPNLIHYSQPDDPITMVTSPFMNSSTIAIPKFQNSKFAETKTSTTMPTLSTSTAASTTGSTLAVNPTIASRFNFQQPLGIVDKYILLAELGQNHLYPVYLASSIFDTPDNSNLVVIKAIPASDYRGSFDNEKNVFQLKYHKNILRCSEIIKNARFFFSSPPNKTSKTTPTDEYYHVLVLKYHSNGDLLDFVKKQKLDERVARYYFSQVLDAVEHLHQNGYCHRDIKIENILLDENYDLVLTDFGHSVKHRDTKGERVFIEQSSITTPGICPPEFHKGHGYRGIPMDIFALGKLLLIFVTGFNPFKCAKDTDQNYNMILKGNWTSYWRVTQNWMKKKWIKTDNFNKDLKALLELMLNPDPSKRPSIKQIRESNWFKKTQPVSPEEARIAMIRAKNS